MMRGFLRTLGGLACALAVAYLVWTALPGPAGISKTDMGEALRRVGDAVGQMRQEAAGLFSGFGEPQTQSSADSKAAGSSPAAYSSAASSSSGAEQALWGGTGIAGLSVYQYGRGLLPPAGRAAYDQIASAVAAVSPRAVIRGTLTPVQVETAYEYFLYDHTEVFYTSSMHMSYTGIAGYYVYSLQFQYLYGGDKTRILALRAQMGAKALAMEKEARRADALGTERALHDQLVRSCSYDTAAEQEQDPSSPAYSAYGALVNGKAVCQGYAQALKLLLSSAGIPSLYVSGTADGGPHAWNMAQVGGRWYYVDATFDDPVLLGPDGREEPGSRLLHTYFNFGSRPDHVLGTFIAANPLNSQSENYAVMPAG